MHSTKNAYAHAADRASPAGYRKVAPHDVRHQEREGHVQVEQLELHLEELQTAQAAAEVHVEPTAAAPTSKKPSRKPLPEHLPREVVTHLPEHDCCPDCGGALRNFGEDVAEILEFIPANFKVIRHVRPKFSCTGCERWSKRLRLRALLHAVLPDPVCLPMCWSRSMRSLAALSPVRDLLPRGCRSRSLHSRRLGGRSSALLAPLVEAVRTHVLSATRVHADDTPVPVLAPGNGRTKTGRLWTYVRDDRPQAPILPPAVWFAYSPDRSGEHPDASQELPWPSRRMLTQDFILFMKAEGSSKSLVGRTLGASSTTSTPPTRRLPPRGPSGASACSVRASKSRCAAARRSGWRPGQARARPVMEELRVWLDQTLPPLRQERYGRSNPLRARALGRAYTLSRRWHRRDQRPPPNARCASSRSEGKTICSQARTQEGNAPPPIYSLLGTAKLNGINPERYLRTGPGSGSRDHPVSRIEELLPWNIAAEDTAAPS